jgi:hypothetical protein
MPRAKPHPAPKPTYHRQKQGFEKPRQYPTIPRVPKLLGSAALLDDKNQFETNIKLPLVN